MTTTRPVVALALVVSLAAPACDSADPAATGGEGASCVQEMLAGYRTLAGPARRVLGGYGAIVRESARLSFAAPVQGLRVTIAEVFDPPFDDVPAKLRPLFARVRGAFRETTAAIREYHASSDRVADAAERCAKSAAGDTAACRAALREMASSLRAAGAAA
ncbi:MAG: hypothetical protein M3279_05570, partial [Actinomycetota bacterium]|nr:hypothetical protein [Actinomycetota bacterium]